MDEERVGHVEVAEQARVAHEPGHTVGRTEQVDYLVDLIDYTILRLSSRVRRFALETRPHGGIKSQDWTEESAGMLPSRRKKDRASEGMKGRTR